MLDYTKAAFQKIKDDFNRVIYVCNVLTQIVYIAYLIYALIAGAGIVWVNGTLLGLSSAYFIFFLLMTSGKTSKEKRKAHTVGKRIFVRCKQLIKIYTLGITVYGVCATATKATPLAIVLTAFMLVGFILQAIFEILSRVVVSRFQFIMEGLEADVEAITKPVKTVSNFFKKVSGQEIQPEKEPTKNRLWLENKVAKNREEKKAKKLAEKEAKMQAKAQAKLEKRAAKRPAKKELAISESRSKK